MLITFFTHVVIKNVVDVPKEKARRTCKYNLRAFEQEPPTIKGSKLKGRKGHNFLVVKSAEVYSYVNKANLYWK